MDDHDRPERAGFGLRTVFRYFGIVARQVSEHFRRHPPHAFGQPLYRAAMSQSDDVDKRLMIQAERQRPAQLGVVEPRRGAVDAGRQGPPIICIIGPAEPALRRLGLYCFRRWTGA